MDENNKRKRIEDADVAERLARLERIADMLDRGEISLPRDAQGNESNVFYADDMERVADFAEDMRGRFNIRAMAESLAKVTPKYPEDFRKSTAAIARYIEANSHEMLTGTDKNADPTHKGLSKVDITARRSKGKGKTPNNVYVWTGIYPDASVLQAHDAPAWAAAATAQPANGEHNAKENTMQNRSKEYIANHREYSRWIIWRCIIDRETADYIMRNPEMRQRIAEYRRPRHARH